MANVQRNGIACLLSGFGENPTYPSELAGVRAKGSIADSLLMHFVNEKLETKMDFRYEKRVFKGRHIAVISIPKQPRPSTLRSRLQSCWKTRSTSVVETQQSPPIHERWQ